MSASIPSSKSGDLPADISFRQYVKSDLKRGIEITAGGWPDLKNGGIDHATMEWYGWHATWKEVACISNVPVGILFGKIYGKHHALDRLKMHIVHAIVHTKMLMGLYGKLPHKIRFLRASNAFERDLKKRIPKVDGELSFFVVDPNYRGLGIGRQLLDNFIKHAREKGAVKICVYTTTPGSDWEFYERHGFKKYAIFRDSFMSVVQNEDVNAIVYALDL